MKNSPSLEQHLTKYRQHQEGMAQMRIEQAMDLEEARLWGVSVLPGQPGVEYHFSVYQRDGMYYDAYDLQDAQVMADNLALFWVGGSKVVRNSDGRVMSYHSFSDARKRAA